MTGFDAELYLRLEGERLLAAEFDSHQHEISPLTVAAEALLAAGVIAEAAVSAVLDDERLVAAIRGDQLQRHLLTTWNDEEDEPAVAVEPLTVPRVVSCDQELPIATGRLRVGHVHLREGETTLAVALDLTTPRRRTRGPNAMPAGPPNVTLTDDRGTSRVAFLNGGGSGTHWEGSLHASPGLAVDTRFIEIDGQRLDLEDDDVTVAEVWIEPLPPLDPALKYLWDLLTPASAMSGGPVLEPGIDALVAAGVFAADAAELVEVSAVAEALGQRHRPPRSDRALPEPWRSVLTPPNRRGPDGTIAISAASPVFDGFAVAVSTLRSDAGGWTIDIEAAPSVEHHSPFGMASTRSDHLVWWAVDDRGHHFLGDLAGWTGDDDHGSGTIRFETPLDPKATSVDLRATARTQRAVIRIPLVWA